MHYEELESRLQIPMMIASLAVIPALIMEQITTAPGLAAFAWGVNALIWVIFLAEYSLLLWLAHDKWHFVRTHKLDLAIIILSPPFLVPDVMASLRAFRALRALRLLRFSRFARLARALRFARLFAFAGRAVTTANRILRRHATHYVVAVGLLLIVLGGGCFYLLESSHVLSLWEGMWWAITTVTTVGYGDIAPETATGKGLAVLMMIFGIGLMATITANIASYFVERDQESESERLLEKMNDIDQRIRGLEQVLLNTMRASGPESAEQREHRQER